MVVVGVLVVVGVVGSLVVVGTTVETGLTTVVLPVVTVGVVEIDADEVLAVVAIVVASTIFPSQT